MDRDKIYPIKIVARRTGLSPHVIRIWERRYDAVVPQRSHSNRRLYCEADIERFILLRKVCELGHGIGQVAKLSTEELRQILSSEITAMPATNLTPAQPASASKQLSANSLPEAAHREACLAAVRNLDAIALDRAIAHGAVKLSRPVLIDQVLVSLICEVGEAWQAGSMRVIHEHLLTAAIKSFGATLRSSQEHRPGAPGMVVTTPAGQIHELGALLAAITASDMGWRTTYLGPNLPAEEIAAALEYNQAQAVALSIVHPNDDPLLENELRRLRRYVPSSVNIIVGGRAAGSYQRVLNEIGAKQITTLAEFREKLAGFQRQHTNTQPPTASPATK
ncbi:MAG: MerR family transcriptional regulator [candidate division KSB1 bacterium]|nr:MerR family transcriptional regulator [candidate division KSB1 bacterium]MDZ7273073.1 MerR family transcriptional regulator [candidate division KSB1 bacterium]MDZ7285176.1 MerR family transcriptional regulator [candidate division KSB1 bacterium]MDZ7298208.1 MerR family transcriptional regulator [candidate division KSB1 bacterium]MDZ7306882.1 MerR family transcriptional regulator [candidate division KSB1 bacterium]